jgi:hypothetical protein
MKNLPHAAVHGVVEAGYMCSCCEKVSWPRASQPTTLFLNYDELETERIYLYGHTIRYHGDGAPRYKEENKKYTKPHLG